MCVQIAEMKYNFFFKQVHGVSMGSSLSPIVTELVLDELFNSVAKKFGSRIKLIEEVRG